MILALLLTVSSLSAADTEKPAGFNSILHRLEAHYGKSHLRFPFGIATFASHFTRPLGASGFQIAIIENVGPTASLPLDPGPGWRPFIRTTSRSGEQVVIYARDDRDNAIHVLLVSLDQDAVVLEMRLAPGAFLKFLAGKSHSN